MTEDASMAAEASTSRPSAHTQRYDRQLRLWASSGQASLENARVLVLGASHLGACVLKNLILPGIGSFTLVDGSSIGCYDLGNNFFIETKAKGQNRAKEVVRNLCELNPSVKGNAIDENPMTFCTETSLEDYSLVIAVNQPLRVLLPLADKLWTANEDTGIPLMALRAAGFVGEVQVQVKEMAIIETHPETTVDLRLTRPWPALFAYAAEYNVEGIDSMEHSHVPFVVIILQKLRDWQQIHDGQLPKPSQNRKEFKDLINSFRRTDNADAENVDEAVEALGQHVWRPISAAQDGSIPSEIQTLLQDKACSNLNEKSSNFWLMARALRQFVEQGDGTLPLPGSLPDMKALSSTYVQLQKLYRQKAVEDLATFKQLLIGVLQSVSLPVDVISTDEIESFAKNASYLKVIRGQRLRDFTESHGSVDGDVQKAYLDDFNVNVYPHHFALLASEKFYEMHKCRYPGVGIKKTEHIIGGNAELNQGEGQEIYEMEGEQLIVDENGEVIIKQDGGDEAVMEESHKKIKMTKMNKNGNTKETSDEENIDDDFDYEEDLGEMTQLAEDLLTGFHHKCAPGTDQAIVDACREITRSGHADLPSTAALLGGIAAQEAIKLVTRQYIPIDNTAIYDGIKQAIGVFRL